MSSTQDLLADRYGRRSGTSALKNRVWAFGVAAIILVLFLVWALITVTAPKNAVAVVSSGAQPLTANSFRVYGEVSRPDGGVVRCALRVQALNFAVVGYREIELPAGTTTFDATVYSFAPGVNASVTGCWLQ